VIVLKDYNDPIKSICSICSVIYTPHEEYRESCGV